MPKIDENACENLDTKLKTVDEKIILKQILKNEGMRIKAIFICVFHGLRDLEGKGNTFLRNVGKHLLYPATETHISEEWKRE